MAFNTCVLVAPFEKEDKRRLQLCVDSIFNISGGKNNKMHVWIVKITKQQSEAKSNLTGAFWGRWGDMNKEHPIRYRSLNALVYVQHLRCSRYDVLFSFFNYSHRIHRKHHTQFDFLWSKSEGYIGSVLLNGCVISTSKHKATYSYTFSKLCSRIWANGEKLQNDRTGFAFFYFPKHVF